MLYGLTLRNLARVIDKRIRTLSTHWDICRIALLRLR